MITTNEQDLYIGDVTENYKGVLKLNYPVEHGVINDWNDMEHLWTNVFN